MPEKQKQSWLFQRRRILLGLSSMTMIAGCQETPTEGEGLNSPESDTAADSIDETRDSSDTQPPTISAFDFEPQAGGAQVAVSMRGKGDTDLARATIRYGERVIEKELTGTEMSIDGVLERTNSTDSSDRMIEYILWDSEGQKARETVVPDEEQPTLTVDTEVSDQAGELDIMVKASDDIGLSELTIFINEEDAIRFGLDEVGGQQEHSGTWNIAPDSLDPGNMNGIRVKVSDWNGNTAVEQTESYIRKFDIDNDNVDFQFSPHYLLFWDGGVSKTFERCAVGTPTVGSYSQYAADFDREAAERHFDQMQGHGISRLQVAFGETDRERETLRRYAKNVELFNEMELEFSHPIVQAFRRDRDIFADYELMTELFQEHNRIATVEGRPVVYFWGFTGLYYQENLYNTITADHGSLTALVSEIRSALTVDGKDPFLVPDIGDQGVAWADTAYEPPDDLFEAITACDGVSHWFPRILGREHQVSREDFIDEYDDLARGTASFAEEFNLAYVPVVYPGFDDRDNTCWGDERHVKRGTDLLKHTMERATELGTTDFAYIATWNDWAEGTMIEPGTYNGERFSTKYLESVQNWQKQAN